MASVADLIAGRYELGVRLGSGGMGDVWRARDTLLDRPVAVKVPASTVTPSSAERFRREARAAARLNHHNVVGVYDWGGGNQPYIVMEFVDGESLRQVLHARHRLPEAEVAAIGAQIADALDHAHHHGVIHRDVKPGNVLLTTDGRVKVTDFGIALSSTAEGLTETGVVLGTVGYLSPEQVAGLPADARSDVYSLGVVLHELLTGERPTGGEDPPRTDVERIVAKCRAPEPGVRYQRAAEVADALRAAVPGSDSTPLTGLVVDTPTVMPTAKAAKASSPANGSVTSAVTQGERTAVLPPARGAALGAAAAAVVAGAVAAPPAPVPAKAPGGRKARKAARRSQKVAQKNAQKNAQFPKVAPAVKPLKPPKPKRVKGARGPSHWRGRHLAAIAAALVAVVAMGALAYTLINQHGPMAAVPAVTDQDVFAAAGALHEAGFDVKSTERSSPKPGGVILSQRPSAGVQLEQGETVHLVVSSTRADVPDVVNEDYDTAVNSDLAKVGLVNIEVVDDFRSDVTPGVVTRTSPVAYSTMRKASVLQVYVARDPHVDVPNLQGTDQAAAIERLKAMGLEVALKTATSKTYASGIVMKNDHVGDTLVRGDTVTLTVSTGPKLLKVPILTNGWSYDDAKSELEDQGFVVAVVTAAVTSSSQDGQVLAQSPAGGTAPEGSTVTLTVGVKARK